MAATDILERLDKVIAERQSADPDSSYVARLGRDGLNRMLEKVGEEAHTEPGSQGVIVHTTDGRRLVAMQPRSATFTPEALSEADVEAKLRQCAAFAGHHTPEQVEAILAAVRTLDQAPDLQPLLDSMTQPSN